MSHGQKLRVARGGRGGRGNEAFKRPGDTAPRLAETGEPGAERWLKLELKLLADVGLVGVPNAGKCAPVTAAETIDLPYNPLLNPDPTPGPSPSHSPKPSVG